MMTLAQFRRSEMERLISEYGITRREFDEFYGDQRSEWIQYLESQAKAGQTFSKPVCRSIVHNGFDLAYWQKFFRCVPGDVLFATGRSAK